MGSSTDRTGLLSGKPKATGFGKVGRAGTILVVVGLLALVIWSLKRTHGRGLNKPLKLRLYTHNIRYDAHHTEHHEKKWAERKQLVTSSIAFNTAGGDANVVGLQEVLHHQLKDILFNLNNQNTVDEWTYYGVGRTDGIHKGEYSPILFKKSEWRLVEGRTFWLSETPDVPSRGWDAALERIVTMVTLQSRTAPLIKLNFFNTHFDHQGVVARQKSAHLIVDRMQNYNGNPSFLTGDFNTEPSDEPYQVIRQYGLKDSRTLIDDLHSYGHTTTFTGFDKDHEESKIIDYIWSPSYSYNDNVLSDADASTSYKIAIKTFAILHSFYHGFYMSDHRPVSADYLIYRTFF